MGTDDFNKRSLEFLKLLDAHAKLNNFSISGQEISIDDKLPSFKIKLEANSCQVTFAYSEHHLDYDQGISIGVNNRVRGGFLGFGVNLFHLRDGAIWRQFLDTVRQHLN
jgi:hypothetical protein